jgi:hypothetical protein
VSASNLVHSHQHVSRTQDEALSVASGELTCPRKPNHVLRLPRIVSIELRAWRPLFEMNRDDVSAVVLRNRPFRTCDALSVTVYILNACNMKQPQERAGNQGACRRANFPLWRKVISAPNFSAVANLCIVAVEMNAKPGRASSKIMIYARDFFQFWLQDGSSIFSPSTWNEYFEV